MNKDSDNLSQQLEKEQFITVMVTDLRDVSVVSKIEKDTVKHREHSGIVDFVIRLNNGVFIKAIDDGMLFRFNSAQDAISAAIDIQKDIDKLNMTSKFKYPVLMRISLHSGLCAVKNNDIPDDIINIVLHMESIALPGETFVSQNTYNAISNKRDIKFRPFNQATTSSEKESFSIYKVLWNPREVERNSIQDTDSKSTEPVSATSKFKLILIVVIPLLLVLLLTLREDVVNQFHLHGQSRDIYYSIE